MNIELVPDLKKYPHIYYAHKDEKLIIFVGAGLSALWGCKRWKDMGISLIEACYEQGHIDYWVRENLLSKHSNSPRKLITIAKNILEEGYLKELKSTVEYSPDRKRRLPNLFNNLFSFRATYITTNIDDHFSSLFYNQCIHFDPNKFSSAIIKPNNIIHLHGIIKKPDSLVMTIDEYLTRYQDDTFRGFLESLFFNEKYCFLFIGYGIDEMEIIDFMVQKYSKRRESLHTFINRFYVLLPFFHNEDPLYKYEQLYFDQIKMTVIPYSINAKGYDQLDEILELWRNVFEFRGEGDNFYEFNEIIERNL